MNGSADSLIQFFCEILTGQDGFAYYTVFVLACGIITGFFFCACFTVFDGICYFVIPFFKRKYKLWRSKEDV